MNTSRVRDTVARVLATIAPEEDLDTIDTRSPLRDQIDLDSVDWLNVLVGLHEKLCVDIPETDYARLVTLDDLIAYLAAKTTS